MRGEYALDYLHGLLRTELPPRARRILRDSPTISPRNGTTSACAENTFLVILKDTQGQNYLRVRGEYHKAFKAHQDGRGTTSACAENTTLPTMPPSPRWNYLRVRGEYCIFVVV